MEVYVARQPIFNKNKKIYGYELLFRASMENFFPKIDGNTATSKLLSNSFFSIGMEKITGMNRAFINFTQDLILKKVPMLFPREKIVVEVLEDVEPEKGVVKVCQEMAKKGYHIALDDFFYRSELEPLIAAARILKLDIRANPLEEIDEFVKKLSNRRVKLLAEKVETYEEFEKATAMGFEYFQGYFFSKPEILKGNDISPHHMNLLELMAEANKRDFQFDKLERLIVREVSLSYKLLLLVNSVYFRRISDISSVRQAIVLIGEEGIRRFLSLIAMAGLAADKPDELIRASVVRAKFCELLGEMNGSSIDPSELFTLGLFSLIDAIMDTPMASLMEKLPLTDSIKRALVNREGKMTDYLTLAEAYGKGEWERISETARVLGIDEEKLPQYYMETLGWADTLTSLQ
jgi:c-di-GMP-related signal transduction protein